jgi:hypothetical protein
MFSAAAGDGNEQAHASLAAAYRIDGETKRDDYPLG